MSTIPANDIHEAPSPLTALPEELLAEVAEHLAASFSLGSLASFNIACRKVHESTLCVLYRSLILVTRDPEGFAEQEKTLVSEQGEVVPSKGWLYTKYLFVGNENLEKLEDLDDELCAEDSDALSLTTLFPRLTLLLLRLREHDEEMVHPQHARNFRPNPEITTITKVWVQVYQPIKPSDLLEVCIMGTNRRETCLADSIISEVPDRDVYDRYPGERGYDPRREAVTDVICKVSFMSTGGLSLDTTRNPRIRGGGEDNLLQIETDTLDEDDSEGSRSRNIAKGILSLYRSRSGSTSSAHSEEELPLITLIGDLVPFQPFLIELVQHLPLKAALRVQSYGMTSTQRFIQQLHNVASLFHAIWEQIKLPRTRSYSTTFFSWTDEGINEADGIPMAYSGILSETANNTAASGFELMQVLQRNDGEYGFAMDRLFYQVRPVREVIVLEETRRGIAVDQELARVGFIYSVPLYL